VAQRPRDGVGSGRRVVVADIFTVESLLRENAAANR
jgi:hypothetical protein